MLLGGARLAVRCDLDIEWAVWFYLQRGMEQLWLARHDATKVLEEGIVVTRKVEHGQSMKPRLQYT